MENNNAEGKNLNGVNEYDVNTAEMMDIDGTADEIASLNRESEQNPEKGSGAKQSPQKEGVSPEVDDVMDFEIVENPEYEGEDMEDSENLATSPKYTASDNCKTDKTQDENSIKYSSETTHAQEKSENEQSDKDMEENNDNNKVNQESNENVSNITKEPSNNSDNSAREGSPPKLKLPVAEFTKVWTQKLDGLIDNMVENFLTSGETGKTQKDSKDSQEKEETESENKAESESSSTDSCDSTIFNRENQSEATRDSASSGGSASKNPIITFKSLLEEPMAETKKDRFVKFQLSSIVKGCQCLRKRGRNSNYRLGHLKLIYFNFNRTHTQN